MSNLSLQSVAFGGQRTAKRSAPTQFTEQEKTALEFKELSEFGVYRVNGVSSASQGPTEFFGKKNLGAAMEFHMEFSQQGFVRSTVHESEDEQFLKTSTESDQFSGNDLKFFSSLGNVKGMVKKGTDEESGNQLPSETSALKIADLNFSEVGEKGMAIPITQSSTEQSIKNDANPKCPLDEKSTHLLGHLPKVKSLEKTE